MVINTRYNLGDKVWYSIGSRETKMISECEYCKGVGKLPLLNGDEIQCPRCHGNKGEFDSFYGRKPCDTPSKIGKVDVELYKKQTNSHKDSKNYMLFATGIGIGIGSGSVWHEDELFNTLEECQTYCEEYNRKEEERFDRSYIPIME